MKDFYNLSNQLSNHILAIFKISATDWAAFFIINLFFLHDRIIKAVNSLLDVLWQTFAIEAGSRVSSLWHLSVIPSYSYQTYFHSLLALTGICK